MPIIRNAVTPISMTFSSDENTRSIGPGIISKHSVPRNISAIPKTIAVTRVFLQRPMFRAA